MGGGPSPDGNDDGEIALVALNGICFICKQKGHRAFQCPNRSPANSGPAQQGGTKPKCAHCHKQVHEEARCWDKPGNQNLKPPQCLKNKEQAAAVVAHNGGGVEILLAALTFPQQLAFLEDPSVWIGDTAATSNSTPHAIGMCDIRKPKASDSIAMGNGMSEVAQKIGNVTGTVCDKFRNQVIQNVKIQDVTLISGGRFNLFSISKLQMEGWIMRGDRDGITLRKGDKSLVFDIVVPTPNGAVFAMYLQRKRATEIANPSVNGTTLSIQQAHTKYAHANEEDTRQMVKYQGVTITHGALGPCEACTIAKAKQKNVPKHAGTHVVAQGANERRIILDIASIKPNPQGWKSPNPNW
jgi:hypothetical protein